MTAHKRKYTIDELETMMDTHTILPDGSVVRKKYIKRLEKKKNLFIQKKLNSEKRKGNDCICMDCGKVIKTRDQSKHLKECNH